MTSKVAFNIPQVAGNEMRFISEAIANRHTSGDGPFTKRCSSFLEKELGVCRTLLTTSCTHALEMAAILLDIQPGDEVIVPSFTFVSTANAFVLRGAKPVFVDIHRDTLNMDAGQLSSLITERTKAIVPVHYAGIGCEMDVIEQIASQRNIAIVEDNAHGLFGKYKGRYLGTFGALATQSFHETKNFHCGEGGALLINSQHFVERAEIIREKGTNRKRFFRGEVDKYSWVDIGSSLLPSDILAAFLYAQFEQKEQIQNARQEIWSFYRNELQEWAAEQGIQLPTVPDTVEQSYHLFYIILPTPADRVRLIKHLSSSGINAVHHYVPLHSSEMSVKNGWNHRPLPATDFVSERLLRLPFYNSLSSDDQFRVINCLKNFKVTSSKHGDSLQTNSLAKNSP